MSNDKENTTKTCFFCSLSIDDKSTLEHIIPDSLLGKLGLKEKTLEGQGKFQYSRIKVPAHKICNSEFGSRYEKAILNLLDSPENLFTALTEGENLISLTYEPANDSVSLITTWLSKIYYGLFYNDYLKLHEPKWKAVCKEIIESGNFKLIQQSYKDNVGFSLPSSLFVFKLNNEDFDIRTFALPEAILIKIKSLVFIMCIGDGYLTKAYLSPDNMKALRFHLSKMEEENADHPLHLLVFAEILALRLSIPKTPKFAYSDKFVLNMSLSTAVKDPESYYRIDAEILNEHRIQLLKDMNITVK
jgi:hypothetical protein